MLSESQHLRAFAMRMRRDTDHTNRQPMSLRVAGTDAETDSTLARLSVPSARILNRPAPTIRCHNFYGAGS